MSNLKFSIPVAFSLFIIVIISCGKKSTIIDPPMQEDMTSASQMDLDIANMILYNDSSIYAKLNSPAHLHHFDSIYHHHDTLYIHHHDTYHHSDTLHHSGWHHTQTQHHQHDSINNTHHLHVH